MTTTAISEPEVNNRWQSADRQGTAWCAKSQMKILQDIATAVRLTGEVRKARKTGASGVQVKPVYTVPAVRFGYWGFTIEGCLFYGPKWQPLRDVFDNLPEKTQHELTFAPKAGEWGDRVRFWKQELHNALEPDLYHEMISTLIRWGIRCRRRALEEVID